MMLGVWPQPTLHPHNILVFGYTSASWRSLCTVAAISVLFSEIAGQTSVFSARSSVSGCQTVYFDCQFQCPPGLQLHSGVCVGCLCHVRARSCLPVLCGRATWCQCAACARAVVGDDRPVVCAAGVV